MAVAHRNTQTSNTGGATAGNVIITKPTGTAVGDILVAGISVDGGSGATVTAPTGWTQCNNSPQNQSTNVQLAVYQRIADGTEGASFTFSFDINRMAAGFVSAYSGGYPYFSAQSNGTTAVASTTLTPMTVQPGYTGIFLNIFGTRNTTATSTVTPNASFTERADTCSTASAFIGVEMQEITNTTPFANAGSGTSTDTQSVTYGTICLHIADNHGFGAAGTGMQIDTFSGNTVSASSATVAAQRVCANFAATVLFAFVAVNKDVQTVSSIAGNSLTWVLVKRTNTQSGSAEIWRAFQPTIVTGNNSFAVTVTFSANVVSAQVLVVGIVGADTSGTNGSGAIGATGTGNGTTSVPTVSLTTTRANSWVWGVVNNPSQNITWTINTNQTNWRRQGDGTNTTSSAMGSQTAITAASGTSVTVDWTNSSTAWNESTVEILQAPNIQKEVSDIQTGPSSNLNQSVNRAGMY